MKSILTILAAGALLATTGCVMFRDHDHHDRHEPPDAVGAGVDHGEHPGDIDHGETMQR